MEIGKKVCAFMDSDKSENVPSSSRNLEVIAWDEHMYTEQRIITDLPVENLTKLIKLAIKLKSEQSIYDAINAKLPGGQALTKDNIESYPHLANLKKVIPKIPSDNEWFKSVGAGEELGNIIFEESNFRSMSSTNFYTKMEQLKVWVNA